MRNKVAFLAVFGLFAVGGTAPTVACESAGPNVHLGRVADINSDAQSFTITDAETGKPITFKANGKLIMRLAGVQRTIAVNYREEDGRLVALEIR